MNVDKAMELTINVATIQQKNWRQSPCPEMTLEHILGMWKVWSPSMSYGKKCRWLGWAQATVVAMTWPYTSLDTMKFINKECSEDPAQTSPGEHQEVLNAIDAHNSGEES